MAKIIIVTGTHAEEVTAIYYAGLAAKKLKAMGHEVRFEPIQMKLPNRPTITGWTGNELPIMQGKHDFRDTAREAKEYRIAEGNPDWFVFRFHNSPTHIHGSMSEGEKDMRERLATRGHSASQGEIASFDKKSKATFLYPSERFDLPNLFTVEIPAVYKLNEAEGIKMADFQLSRKAGLTDKRILEGVTKQISRLAAGKKTRVIVPRGHPKAKGTVLAKRKRIFRV